MLIRRSALDKCNVLFLLASALLFFSASFPLAAETERPLGSTGSIQQMRCHELVSGDFFVEECIQRSVSTDSSQAVSLSVPGPMLGLIAAELQWFEPFLAELFSTVEVSGTYSRRAKWQDQEMQQMAAHPFATRLIPGTRSIFDLAIANHAIRSLRAEFDSVGNGFLEIFSAGNGEIREVFFEDGLIASTRGGVSKGGDFYMGCYIDTPAYDQFRANFCAQLGFQPSTVVFKVFLPYTPESVVWSSPNSTCSGLFCTVPISPGQTVYGYAYWVINGIPTGPVSASATYESLNLSSPFAQDFPSPR